MKSIAKNALKRPLGLVVFLLLLCGCSEPKISDREAIIRAVLIAEVERLHSRDRLPCVQPGLWRSGDIPTTYEQVDSFPSSWLPSQLEPCRGQGEDIDGTIWLTGVENRGIEVLVDIDHQCGGMCGEGATYRLQRFEKGWRVLDRQQQWLS